MTACSVPDLSPNIAEAVQLLADTDRQLRPALTPVAAAELAAAEEAMMRNGQQVLGFGGNCDAIATRAEGGVVSECRLVERALPVTGPVNTTQALRALDVLGGYFAAIGALAAAESSDEVAARSGTLLDALAALGNGGGPDAFVGLGARRDLIVRSTSFVAAQYRIAALHRVVRRADPVIGEMTDIAVAWLDDLPGGVPEAQAALLDARDALATATEARNLPAQRSATAELRAAHARFRKAEAESPANRLLLLRKLHAGLRNRLEHPQSAKELLATLEEIKAITELAKKED